MRHLRRFSVWLILLLVIALATIWGLGVASLPRVDGTLTVEGLDGPVAIHRDARGVPSIVAENDLDAYFGLGFVHAQDRLFQLDLHRRIAAGRLSEVIGARGLNLDRAMRTLGLEQAARSSLAVLDPATRDALDAYAAGTNAGRQSLSLLPPEYLLLGVDFAPWRPIDSLLFSRLMALRLSGNWRDEALNAALIDVLGPDRFTALWDLGRDDGMTMLSGTPSPTGLGPTLTRLTETWPAEAAPLLASNWWAVDGAHSGSGGALLANDPHLELQAPIQWYLATLETPEWTVSGGTMPAIPFHLVGHNGHIAWGLTTTHSDTADLVIETLADGGYHTPDGTLPFSTRTERIAVQGGPEDRLEVRETRHGPVVSDLVDLPLPKDRVVVLEAAALAAADSTANAARALTRATSWDDALSALRAFHAPQQNIAIASADGMIGVISPGRVPLRGPGDTGGILPRDGTMADQDWRGWLPFESLPQEHNPATGHLINANNRPVPKTWPVFLGADFPPPYRANRIADLVEAMAPPTADAMAAAQLDTLSPTFAVLRPYLAVLPASPARDMLLAWDGRMAANRPAPLLYAAFLIKAKTAIFADDLGTTYAGWSGHRIPETLGALADNTGAWCAQPGCPDELAQALDGASASLKDAFGDDMAVWRWGVAHRATLEHPLFRRLPALAELTSLSGPTDGGAHTVNRGDFSAGPADAPWRRTLADRHGPGLRLVVDMATPEQARAVIATGQSGHPLSAHYGDQTTAWRDGHLWPLRSSDAAVAMLQLVPAAMPPPVRNTR